MTSITLMLENVSIEVFKTIVDRRRKNWALVMDAVDGAKDYEDAAQKLSISRQGLLQAMERLNIGARKISHLEVVIEARSNDHEGESVVEKGVSP